jgi:hypothetical protein
VVRPAAAPRIATVQVNGLHRILVIPRRAAWGGTMSRLVNAEAAKISRLREHSWRRAGHELEARKSS